MMSAPNYGMVTIERLQPAASTQGHFSEHMVEVGPQGGQLVGRKSIYSEQALTVMGAEQNCEFFTSLTFLGN